MGRRDKGKWGMERSEEERGEARAPGSPFKSLIITVSIGLHMECTVYKLLTDLRLRCTVQGKRGCILPKLVPPQSSRIWRSECCSQSRPSQHEDVDVCWMSVRKDCHYLHTRDNVIMT